MDVETLMLWFVLAMISIVFIYGFREPLCYVLIAVLVFVLFCAVCMYGILWMSFLFHTAVFNKIVSEFCAAVFSILPTHMKVALKNVEDRVRGAMTQHFSDKKWTRHSSTLPKCGMCYVNEACMLSGRCFNCVCVFFFGKGFFPGKFFFCFLLLRHTNPSAR